MDIERNAGSSGAYDLVLLQFYKEKMTRLASSSFALKKYGYECDKIVLTRFFSLNQRLHSDSRNWVSKTIEDASLVYAEF